MLQVTAEHAMRALQEGLQRAVRPEKAEQVSVQELYEVQAMILLHLVLTANNVRCTITGAMHLCDIGLLRASHMVNFCCQQN